MDELVSATWLEARGPLSDAHHPGLARAEALLVDGRLGEGLRALGGSSVASRAASELRATWLLRLGAADEARGIAEALSVGHGPVGPPTVHQRVRAALDAQRLGDLDEALLQLEHAAARCRAEDAPRSAQRVEVQEVVLRLARRRSADRSRAEAVCQVLPDGAVRDALTAWLDVLDGGTLEPFVACAEALPQRVLGAELLGAAVALARERVPTARADSEERLVRRLEELGLTLPPRLRGGLFETLGPSVSRSRSRLPPPEPESPARERLARLFQTLTRLARERDLPRLLERITDGAVDLTGAERGLVLLSDDHGVSASVESPLPQDAVSDVAFSRSIALSVMQDGRPIVTVDAQHDPRLRSYESVHHLALTSVACVPIRGRAGVLGALYLEHRARRARFDADDLDLLLAFADQVAVALETHAALRALEAQRDELRAHRDALEETRAALEDALARQGAELADTRRTLARVVDPAQHGYETLGIVGRSPALREALALVDRVRDTNLPVVFRGESGTGKELFARALHASGPRRSLPFIALACGALTESLLESELFGHVRGAFTGADRARDGVFVRASGGTLFLDELEDMPAKMQVDLLRVLQEGRVRPLGAEHDVTVDVRIVCATRRPLGECVAAGRFREDLFYRLQVVEVVVPPLRERTADLPQLTAHVLGKLQKERGGERMRVTPAALALLAEAELPGNVRQLEHLLASASLLAEGRVLDAPLFEALLCTPGNAGRAPRVPVEETRVVASDGLSTAGAAPATTPGTGTRVADAPPPATEADWKALERERILVALEASGWNRARAALDLGMPRRTFYRRLKEHGIL